MIRMPSASYGATSYPIGKAELHDTFIHHDASFETACWWQDVKCEPQVVTLWSNGYMVSYGFKGVTTDGYFGSGFGGVYRGDDRDHSGKDATWNCSGYAYNFSGEDRIAKDHDGNQARVSFTFAPGYGVGYEDRMIQSSGPDKEREHRFYHILMPEEGHTLEVKHVMRDDKLTINGARWIDETHAYDVFWKQNKIGRINVRVREGFNGNTYSAAIKQALTLIKTEGLAALSYS